MNQTVLYFLFIVQWAILLFTVLLVIGILRQLKSMTQSSLETVNPSRFSEGEALSDIDLVTADGQPTRLLRLPRNEDGTVIAVISMSCKFCSILLEQIRDASETLASSRTLAIVVTGATAVPDELADLVARGIDVAVDKGGIINEYSLKSVPFGMIVDARGRLTEQTRTPHMGGWISRALGNRKAELSVAHAEQPFQEALRR